MTIGSPRVDAQTVDGSLDVPQTRLAPLGTPMAPYTPSVGQPLPSPYSGTSSGIVPSSGSGFDPYASGPAGGYIQPSSPPVYGGASAGGMFGSAPPQSGFGAPIYGGAASQPPPLINGAPMFSGGNQYATPPPIIPSNSLGAPVGGGPGMGFPQSAYPSGTPSSLFPGGIMSNTGSFDPNIDPYRIIQRGRFRYEFISDGGKKDWSLMINNVDLAFAFACERFFGSTQPLFITPAFSLHLFDGPNSNTGADLPAQTYSAFLDFSWRSDPMRFFGAELGVNVGYYSEPGVSMDDGLRLRGKGLATFRLTPATTIKLGAYYYDRVKVKLLPAFGMFCRPDSFTRWDIFFPEPKYSHYVSTVGTQDVWWYVAGAYGGGSWAIERDGGGNDQVDVNDIRVMLGLEWGESNRMRVGLRTWHVEIGYQWNRELIYRYNPQDNLELDDALMVRMGIGY